MFKFLCCSEMLGRARLSICHDGAAPSPSSTEGPRRSKLSLACFCVEDDLGATNFSSCSKSSSALGGRARHAARAARALNVMFWVRGHVLEAESLAYDDGRALKNRLYVVHWLSSYHSSYSYVASRLSSGPTSLLLSVKKSPQSTPQQLLERVVLCVP